MSGWNGLGPRGAGLWQAGQAGAANGWRHWPGKRGRKLPVRLVKGAYWDTEIKRAQEAGFEAYPLFTRKVSTDVSYLACAKFMLANRDAFYPQFATHNAHSIAAITVMAGNDRAIEFQRLHGMGQALYEQVVGATKMNLPCRIYAPVGSHEDLLAYLVRRLLENGANTSFVNRLADDDAPDRRDHCRSGGRGAALAQIPHPRIPARAIFLPGGMNSAGLCRCGMKPPAQDRHDGIAGTGDASLKPRPWLMASRCAAGQTRNINAPHDNRMNIGLVHEADEAAVTRAMASASTAQHDWDMLGGDARAAILEKAADALRRPRPTRSWRFWCGRRERRSTMRVADLREAVDFLRYYARPGTRRFHRRPALPGPTGESNELTLHGRGVFACIAPWNFPLAIFTGQVAAALAAGNAVMAKPAEQTPLVAFEAVKLAASGWRSAAESCISCPAMVRASARRCWHIPALAGVAFTGSNETAAIINRALGRPRRRHSCAHCRDRRHECHDRRQFRPCPSRRCAMYWRRPSTVPASAARRRALLFVQDDVAPRIIPMLQGRHGGT